MRALLPLAVLALAIAGCTAPEEAEPQATDADAAVAKKPQVNTTFEPEAEPVVVYAFSGEVAGASPPGIDGGGVTDTPAKEETFTVTEANLTLYFEESGSYGMGAIQIQIFGPDGSAVWDGPVYHCAGVPKLACVGLVSPASGSSLSEAPVGDYIVKYWVGGAFSAAVTVSAAPEGAEE